MWPEAPFSTPDTLPASPPPNYTFTAKLINQDSSGTAGVESMGNINTARAEREGKSEDRGVWKYWQSTARWGICPQLIRNQSANSAWLTVFQRRLLQLYTEILPAPAISRSFLQPQQHWKLSAYRMFYFFQNDFSWREVKKHLDFWLYVA